jgi:hypothetical protein
VTGDGYDEQAEFCRNVPFEMAHSAEICHLKWQISVASNVRYVLQYVS